MQASQNSMTNTASVSVSVKPFCLFNFFLQT